MIPSVMVTVSDPYPSEPGPPLRLRTAVYERDMAEHKYVATVGLIYQRRLARAEGYDDVLFVDRQGRVAEGSIWIIALWGRADGHILVRRRPTRDHDEPGRPGSAADWRAGGDAPPSP